MCKYEQSNLKSFDFTSIREQIMLNNSEIIMSGFNIICGQNYVFSRKTTFLYDFKNKIHCIADIIVILMKTV